MRAIGFRITPNEVFYSIVEGKDNSYEFISITSLVIPAAMDAPCKLSYIRNIVSTILLQYNILYAGIKLIEGNACRSLNNSAIFRFNIEGLIMELFANSQIKSYFLGLTPNIASALHIERDKPHVMLSNLIENLDDIITDEKSKLTSENKDSMIVALAALEKGPKYE